MKVQSQRSAEHQQAVLERRRSGATNWDSRPKRLRTRQAQQQAARKDQER